MKVHPRSLLRGGAQTWTYRPCGTQRVVDFSGTNGWRSGQLTSKVSWQVRYYSQHRPYSSAAVAQVETLESPALSEVAIDATQQLKLEAVQVEGANELPFAVQAFVALGSNVGDRLHNIEQACREMNNDPQIELIRTSGLYETEPMYVTDQASFLNATCEIETTLKPIDLLDKLQEIELRLGRVKTIEKGPRSVDLDILFYGDTIQTTERLTVPHPLMKEREFVLRPLSDIPSAQELLADIKSPLSITQHLEQVAGFDGPVFARTPLRGEHQAIVPEDPKRTTRLMSIVNMTTDSFSDGGRYASLDTRALQLELQAQIDAGASIIDIGGQSSRPGAPDVSVEEEIARLVPVIKAIRSLGDEQASSIPISIDTYRAAVAEAAINAGADIVNDISAGTLDPNMLKTVARLGCTYVMMHMRGTPETMQSEENCSYPRGLLPTIADEISLRVDAALEIGVHRWRIILDPGIGFAKRWDQNMEILRSFGQLKADLRFSNMPWLIGTSRKSFLGKVTGVQDPAERKWATAASVTASIKEGANIVRVHDVSEMAQVIKFADALYRNGEVKSSSTQGDQYKGVLEIAV